MNRYLLALMAAIMIAPTYADGNRLPGVYPRDSVIFGRTYGEWSAAWRQWADSMPATKHPLFDTAEDCSEGQSGPVWFLGGRFCAADVNTCDSLPAVRECRVPAGKALYFPVLNTACLDGEAKNALCLDAGPFITQIRATVAGIIDQTTGLRVSVDGKPLNVNLKKEFRVQSPVYTSILPEGNLYQALGEPQLVAGSYWGVDDGIYLMLEPLSKGVHTLNFKGSFPQFDFDLDFTYRLIVR
jgi:hypothetical protein